MTKTTTCVLCNKAIDENMQLAHLIDQHGIIAMWQIPPNVFVENLCQHENAYIEKSTTASWGASFGEPIFDHHRCEDCGYEWTD